MNRLLSSALIAAAIVSLAACSAASGGRPTGSPIDPDAVIIVAKDLKFSATTVSVPANERFQIVFDNQESAPHNVAIYRDSSATDQVFRSEPFSGPAMVTYDAPALTSGTYFFRCDLHPDMSGELVVE
jgi:plastocyanin